MKLKQQFHAVFAACILTAPLIGCGSGSDSGAEPAQSEATVEKSVSAYIQSAQGTALADAAITIAGQTFKTDSNGLAVFKVRIPSSASSVPVRFTRVGFINQSVVVNVKDLANITANMLDIKQVVNVAKIEDAQVIESAYSNAKITIPANAFVLPNGQPAAGAVMVEFSPWDIQSSDLNAMPANGVAITANGQITNLISAGMITATFKNAAGEHLQLAKGKTADLQMDLPVDSINNQVLSVGTKIPMWHFDEAKGMWVEEGEGQVIASLRSPVLLAVHATVSHFSTWNWDFKFENPGSVNVKCQSANVFVPCNITAKVVLKDGSGWTKTNSISAEGVDIINMPSEGQIQWTAKDTSGTLIGSKTSTLPNDKNVVIDLGAPTTNNFVKCMTADNKAAACSGQFNGVPFSVPKEGGRIISGLKNAAHLNWAAAGDQYEQGNAVYQASGTATSGLTGNVTIKLSTVQKLFDQHKINLRCNSSEAVPAYCMVYLRGNYTLKNSSVEQPTFYKQFRLPLNQTFSVYLPIPPQAQTEWGWVSADGVLEKGNLQKPIYWSTEDIYQESVIQFDFDAVSWCDASMNDSAATDIVSCWIPQ
jgi:hypothetical protein